MLDTLGGGFPLTVTRRIEEEKDGLTLCDSILVEPAVPVLHSGKPSFNPHTCKPLPPANYATTEYYRPGMCSDRTKRAMSLF